MHMDESHSNDKMGHRHARINTRSFVVSIKFLRTVCYSYIAVLTFNVIYSTIFDFEDVKLNLEDGDKGAETGLSGTITCMTKEFKMLAVTSCTVVKAPQTWLWRSIVVFGSGISFYLVPLFVENKKLVRLSYAKEIGLMMITFYIDLKTPVIEDPAHFGIWVIHIIGVLILGVSSLMMAIELKYTWHIYGFGFTGPMCIILLAISRLLCWNYFYSVFIIFEYIAIVQIILLHLRFFEENIACVNTFDKLEYHKMRRPKIGDSANKINEILDENQNLADGPIFLSSNPDLKKRAKASNSVSEN